jgi:hypothetical protein
MAVRCSCVPEDGCKKHPKPIELGIKKNKLYVIKYFYLDHELDKKLVSVKCNFIYVVYWCILVPCENFTPICMQLRLTETRFCCLDIIACNVMEHLRIKV